MKVACGSGPKPKSETRHTITDLMIHPNLLPRGIRSHWEIESFHWDLVTAFDEDRCNINRGKAPEVLSLMRKLAYNSINPLRDAHGKSMPAILLLLRNNSAFLEAVLEKGQRLNPAAHVLVEG